MIKSSSPWIILTFLAVGFILGKLYSVRIAPKEFSSRPFQGKAIISVNHTLSAEQRLTNIRLSDAPSVVEIYSSSESTCKCTASPIPMGDQPLEERMISIDCMIPPEGYRVQSVFDCKKNRGEANHHYHFACTNIRAWCE